MKGRKQIGNCPRFRVFSSRLAGPDGRCRAPGVPGWVSWGIVRDIQTAFGWEKVKEGWRRMWETCSMASPWPRVLLFALSLLRCRDFQIYSSLMEIPRKLESLWGFWASRLFFFLDEQLCKTDVERKTKPWSYRFPWMLLGLTQRKVCYKAMLIFCRISLK